MNKTEITTVLYIRTADSCLMLHRIRKNRDLNKGKWIGIGGHLESGESPEECVRRETFEESGLTLGRLDFRGIVTFVYHTESGEVTELMFVFTSSSFEGSLTDCDEGVLAWVPKEDIPSLSLWEGDRIFLSLLDRNVPFFSLKLCYDGDRLSEAVLNEKPLELLDIRNEDGSPTGLTRERACAHEEGTLHGTSHVWIARRTAAGPELLLQKRSDSKDSFPGCYDISSAGHIPAGSDFVPSALRELHEELGIAARPEDLKEIGACRHRFDGSFRGRPFHDNEYSRVYLYLKPVDEKSLVLQSSEVDSVRWFPLDEVREAVRTHNPAFCVHGDEIRMIEDALGAVR
ncbi:MAG: NUDIX domain-containing protein [Lachnospiraceae bacterium]|jgi:8-oxo-dGTP diphosphatase